VKLFKFDFIEDFGEEVYINFLMFKDFTVLAITGFHEVYGSPPCFELVIGLGQLVSILIGVPRWTLKVQLFAKRY